MTSTAALPSHIEETTRAIAKLQSEHEEKASALQRFVNRLTAFASRPSFLVLVTCFIALWAIFNAASGCSVSPP
jgi:uncharacterized membrane protein